MIIKNKNIFYNMEQKIKLPKSIDELNLRTYLQFFDVLKDMDGEDKESINNTLRTYKLMEILTGSTEEEIDNLKISESNELAEKIMEIIKDFKGFDESQMNNFEIDGVNYVGVDMNGLDNGEYISLNMLKEQYGNSVNELIPRMLAILIRPGKKEYDFERKEEVWSVEKFNKKDIANLELRKEIFLDKAKAKDVIPIVNFFLSGMQKLA